MNFAIGEFFTDLFIYFNLTDRQAQERIIKFRHDIDGTLTRIGGPNFSDLIVQELHGNLPGDYYKPRPLPPKLLRTAANARAREGQVYWYMEKPPRKRKNPDVMFLFTCSYSYSEF